MSNIMRSGLISVLPYLGGTFKVFTGDVYLVVEWINIYVLAWHGKCLTCHVHTYVLSSAHWDTTCISILTHVLMSSRNIWFTRVSFNHYQHTICQNFVTMGVCKIVRATSFLLSNPSCETFSRKTSTKMHWVTVCNGIGHNRSKCNNPLSWHVPFLCLYDSHIFIIPYILL